MPRTPPIARPAPRRPASRERTPPTPHAARERPSEGGLPWLTAQAGRVHDAAGATVRLCGLHGAEAQADQRDVAALLGPVPEGRRVVALTIDRVAQTKGGALDALEAHMAQLAQAGVYTLLRIAARLWLHGHHLRLARRHADDSAVLFALLGRAPLADALWSAARSLLGVHRRALVWLPLESSRAALAGAGAGGIGLLWDAARPQAPRRTALAAARRRPLMLDGWQPGVQPLADARLMRLCRDGGIGWLARSGGAWATTQRGIDTPTRSARALVHALHIDAGAAAPN